MGRLQPTSSIHRQCLLTSPRQQIICELHVVVSQIFDILSILNILLFHDLWLVLADAVTVDLALVVF